MRTPSSATARSAVLMPPMASWGRVIALGALLLAVLVVLVVLSLMLGVTKIPAEQVFHILWTGEGERVPQLVITTLRLPRALLGILLGAAMALTGVTLQDSLRNVLADPGLLGVSMGASLVVAIIVVFHLPIPFGLLPVFALLGGLACGLLILLTTRLTRDPVRTILVGAALSALVAALITTVVVLARPNELQVLYSFLVGSLIGRNQDDLWMVLPWLGIGIPLSLCFGRLLNVLQLGDDMAEGLGLPVLRVRFGLFLVSIGMTAAIVAVAGPIGFVALIAPHMTRYLLRTSDSRQVLWIAALLGATLLLAADLLAREIFSPAELPVGLVLTVVGSPLALFLLRRSLQRTAAR
ncbi:MAG: iron ABC transporter permease [Caldilineaceae bacterium]|nr:iron ABC transporter permease [Caldilineaceae bacterium]